ncbi:hypothetical protein GJR96_08455 [Haloferax sp. MBLA0076]|uniref:Uncharacterized protein n=1 Tax=Haloferax litoreum TaxID=2666140 RepID=A0A6A8GGI2_9EURY|nr:MULTISPECIES: hypothetical protein [Haloferax]KAB1193473.1 hypothetical protein Hfx1148_08445 [Haloferax sp. CBA1148]MRX21986.1 hypothetical protein [Haloferax litoreum]
MADNDYITTLLREGQEVHTIRSGKQVDAMVTVTEILSSEYDLLENIEIPYKPDRKKTPIIEEITDEDEDIRRQKYEFTEGYYVDTLVNKRGKQIDISRLASACGLEVEFSGAWE